MFFGRGKNIMFTKQKQPAIAPKTTFFDKKNWLKQQNSWLTSIIKEEEITAAKVVANQKKKIFIANQKLLNKRKTIKKIEYLCNEINHRIDSIVLDFEAKRPDKREVCRLITRWPGEKNYGFKLMNSYSGGYLEFFIHNYHLAGYYTGYKYNRRHIRLIKTRIDFNKIEDKDIQEWIEFIYTGFARNVAPTILRGQKTWRKKILKIRLLDYMGKIIDIFHKFKR
jgi:hypothetical protein